MTRKVVLVDLDGPLADFEGGFLKLWKEKFPHDFFVPVKERKTFYLTEQYPEEFSEKIQSIRTMAGFIRGLRPIKEGVEAIKEMIDSGFHVFVCSSEIYTNLNGLTEKKLWMQEYLGDNLTRSAIFTKDKTMVRGDYLIDDKPEIGGLYTPQWKHVIFDQPFNRNIAGKLRLNTDWSNWREVIL